MKKLWKQAMLFGMVLCAAANLAVAGAVAMPEETIAIDSSNFPDSAFQTWVQTKDTDGDGLLSQAERDAVTQADLRKCGIQDLRGLEWFSSLETLNCSENDLTRLELPDLPALKSLTCNENARLEVVDLRGAPALEQFSCFHSNLTELDLHAVPNLQYCVWGGSPLQELDLSGNSELRVLHVLGGDLTSADLSHNPKLDTLLWNHTRIGALDLSHQQDLTYLNCTDNRLTRLDLSQNPKLETLYANNNQLLAVQIPESVTFCELTGQRPASWTLEPGQNSLSLSQLAPWMRADAIENLSGGTLQDDRIVLDAPNQTLTYRYTDGVAQLDATLNVTGENGWAEPLHIDDWTYGDPPAQPQARPAFGTVTFSYATSEQGPFQSEPPESAGTWYVRAQVEATAQYNGLEATESFEIHPAVPTYTTPETKYATYGDYLAYVALDAGFYWENGSLHVGDAGEQTHWSFYVPHDNIDYQIVGHIPVQVKVAPYDGTLLPIPTLSSRDDAEQMVIRHGDWVLEKDKDYTLQFTTQNGQTQCTIQFQGNYTGTVVRSFAEEVSNHSGGGSSSGSTGGGGGGQPVTPQPPVDQPDNGVSDWLDTTHHGAYIHGYPDGRFGPEGTLTRAEAAQMFDSLLKDRDVPITAHFADVPDDAWYAEAVNRLASLGMVVGVGEDRFLPDRGMTRAEFVAIAVRFAKPVAGDPYAFPDVPEDAWFYDAVMDAVHYGWISGNPDGTFAPNAPVTRAEATAILNRMLGRSADPDYLADPTGLRTFSDVPATHWAYADICEAANAHTYEKNPAGESWKELL